MDNRLIAVVGADRALSFEECGGVFEKVKTVTSTSYEVTEGEGKTFNPEVSISHFQLLKEDNGIVIIPFQGYKKQDEFHFIADTDLKIKTQERTFSVSGNERDWGYISIRFL